MRVRSVRRRMVGGLAAAVFTCVTASGQAKPERLSGSVKIDGSSTVCPSMIVASELFTKTEQPKVKVPVGVSGTGGGFKKFLDSKPDLRTDINDASRPITAEEISKAKELGIDFIELPLSYDGLSVVVNKKNTFCDHLTVDELKKIWAPDSKIKNWKDVRAGFPDLPLKLYGPGTDSGTFDYFTEVIVGKAKASRADYNASEDDNVLVLGVAGDPGGLGYFGFSYLEANEDKIKAVGIDKGDGKPVAPTMDTIRSGTYAPLSRPLLFYVNKESAKRPEVAAFVNFVLGHAREIVENRRVKDIALSDAIYAAARERFAKGVTGSVFEGGKGHAKNLADLYTKKD